MRLFFVLPFLFACNAFAQNLDSLCEGAIDYNSSEVSYNLASRLAVWESIDRNTYEKRRSGGGLGVSVYGIPINFSYEQFEEERSRLRQSLVVQNSVNISSAARWQAVDPGSTERYIACLDANSNKKFTASVVLVSRQRVFIRVKKVENSGQKNVDFVLVEELSGGKTGRKKIKLVGNSGTTLAFSRDEGLPFDVALIFQNRKSEDIDSASFSIPRYINIRNSPIEVTLSSQKTYCNHSYAGPAVNRVNVSAASDENLLIESRTLKWEDLDPSHCSLGAVKEGYPVLNNKRIEMEATCGSNDNKCTKPYLIWFEVKALKDRFVDAESGMVLKGVEGR